MVLSQTENLENNLNIAKLKNDPKGFQMADKHECSTKKKKASPPPP
jgi:hypothetical protein